MSFFSVPPIAPPLPPTDITNANEVSLWTKRVSGYLNSLSQFLEEVSEAYIANTVQLASEIITADQIAASAVTTAKIEDSAITSVKIQDSGIATVDLADSAITTAKLADSAVTTVKIESSTITTVKLVDSAVTAVKIESSTITTAKLIDSAITSVKIENSAVTNLELVARTQDNITAHASVGGWTTVSFAISRDKTPLVVPSSTASNYLVSLGNVTTASADVNVYNVNGATSCTVYISYH